MAQKGNQKYLQKMGNLLEEFTHTSPCQSELPHQYEQGDEVRLIGAVRTRPQRTEKSLKWQKA